MKRPRRQGVRFAVCIKNRGYEASLEVGKLYRVVPDEDAEKRGYLRIVDESGEDYGYAARRFFAGHLPKPLETVLLRVASSRRSAEARSSADALSAPLAAYARRRRTDQGGGCDMAAARLRRIRLRSP